MAIVLHSYFAYPESYTIIKQWWNESGRETERSDYFIPLIRMGDPDARKLFDEKINQCLKSNGISSNMIKIDSALNGLRNSYSVAKLIELLRVDIHYEKFSEGDPGMPYNCYVINDLLNNFIGHSIKINGIKTSDPCDVQKKHLPEIKTAAQKLIEAYKAEEYYWLKNMPFYK